MSNPVVFFDMEIGGQPAGRIEMTVRRRRKKTFFLSGDDLLLLLLRLFFLSFVEEEEEDKSHLDRHSSLDRFFSLNTVARRFVYT